MRNKPRIRFKGFTEDWEQRKLGDVVKSYSGGTPTASNKEYYGGDIPFIRSAEINSDTTELYITQKGLDNSSAKIVEKGTILYAMYGATSGEVGISKINGAINQAILAMIPLEYNGKIIAQYLRKNKESIIGKYLQGGQGNLSANIILELPIQLPGLEESNQIANFLESFDNIITLHRRKLEKLKLAKKALLQKLFPKKGSQFPEIRFKGFTDAWEQRKLGDFTNQINTFVNPEDAKLPLWSLTAEAGLIEKSDRYERDFLVKKKDQFKRIETNTLIYNPMNITIGSIDIYTGLYPIAVSGYYVSIVYDKNIDTDFLKEVLLLPSSLKMYKNYATGSLIERQRVQYPTFSKLQLLVPNLDEQKAIGQFFKLLNLNITLHQCKLDKLQEVKKGLLQKMFV